MISSSKALFIIIGFSHYFAVDSTCPSSGFIHTIATGQRSCTGLIGPFTSYDTNTWNDGSTSVVTSTLIGTYVSGQLLKTQTGNVVSGTRFNGSTVTAEYAYANVNLDCLTNGDISGLIGTVQLNIVNILGLRVFSCVGTAKLSYDPPLTNTPQTVTITSDVNYTTCTALLIC